MEPQDPSFPAEPAREEPLEADDYYEAILRLELSRNADADPISGDLPKE